VSLSHHTTVSPSVSRNLLETVSRCLSHRHSTQHTDSDFDHSIPKTHPVALVSFVHRPTPSGDHTPAHDLEFFHLARTEYGLRSTLLVERWEEEDEEMVYLYSLHFDPDSQAWTRGGGDLNHLHNINKGETEGEEN
jgi:hypothetical protein